MKKVRNEDTIAAIATPPGEGGIGIVRLSGARAIEVVARVFSSSRGRDLRTTRARVLHGHIHCPEGELLDEVLVHVMRGPRTYTREDVVEISGHGGAGPLNAILDACLTAGARLARPGEFTLRAFLNGRIDLVQAEAVIDLIRARTKAALVAANAAAAGRLSGKLHEVRDRIAHALAHVEAAVDFPEEDLPDLVTPALIESLREAHRTMLALIETADAGRMLREGAAVAIAGRPNVGKSSLFNALLRDTRAIVSAHAGTTRDRIEEFINLNGVPVRLVDMAGLRTSADAVEQIGVQVAREALQGANAVLFVVDGSLPFTEEDAAVAEEVRRLEVPALVVINKIDLAPAAEEPALAWKPAGVFRVSAQTGIGLDMLESGLERLLMGGRMFSEDQTLLTRLHQKDSLRRAADSLGRMLSDTRVSPEFLALDLRESLQALGEITGETTPDDLLEIIFSSFCIGK